MLTKKNRQKGKAAEREKGSFSCCLCIFLAGFFLDRTNVFSFCACLLYGSLWSGNKVSEIHFILFRANRREFTGVSKFRQISVSPTPRVKTFQKLQTLRNRGK